MCLLAIEREHRKLNKAARTTAARESQDVEAIIKATVAAVNSEPLPQTVEAKESFFMEQVGMGEMLAQRELLPTIVGRRRELIQIGRRLAARSDAGRYCLLQGVPSLPGTTRALDDLPTHRPPRGLDARHVRILASPSQPPC